jgi:hypothetical protein
MSDDQDWRLVADVEQQVEGTLERLVNLADPSAGDAALALPADTVLTHDEDRLFAYAGSRSSVDTARGVLEKSLADEGVTARIIITRWDDETGVWLQVDPPPSDEEARAVASALASAQQSETQTFVCKVGRGVRRDLEESMLEWAARLGLRCEIVEHAHFMTTQMAFTVTGPHHRVEEFRDGLRAESVSTMRSGALLGLEPL